MERLEFSARSLGLLWAGSWTWFFVRQTLEWRTVIPATVVWIALGILFMLLAFVPWRWERVGGLLLIICGLGLLTAYTIWPPMQVSLVRRVIYDLLLAGPPLLAGFLFLIHRIAVADAEPTVDAPSH